MTNYVFDDDNRILYDTDLEPLSSFDGSYSFLSNFAEIPVVYEGRMYPTGEHAYQAAKTSIMAEQEVIATAPMPGKAKRLGRACHMDADFENRKFDIMYEIETAKFFNFYWRDELLKTFPYQLIEGNTWHDNIWGNCICSKCKNTSGQNNLGNTLMNVRADLMEAERAFFINRDDLVDCTSPDPDCIVSFGHVGVLFNLSKTDVMKVIKAGLYCRNRPATDNREDLFWREDWDGIFKGLE